MSIETSVTTADTLPGKAKSEINKFKASGIITGLTIGSVIVWGIVTLTAPPNLASNEEVRTAYNVDIIDNPNFTGKDMLKVNDEKLAEFCVRPTVKDVQKKVPLNCKVA